MSVVFFFKQKTAYEMRISDWSSDVCSSDLMAWLAKRLRQQPTIPKSTLWAGSRKCKVSTAVKDKNLIRSPSIQGWRQPLIILCLPSLLCHLVIPYLQVLPSLRSGSYLARSEEHTSELQSLMRISYAVFCLQKKK